MPTRKFYSLTHLVLKLEHISMLLKMWRWSFSKDLKKKEMISKVFLSNLIYNQKPLRLLLCKLSFQWTQSPPYYLSTTKLSALSSSSKVLTYSYSPMKMTKVLLLLKNSPQLLLNLKISICFSFLFDRVKFSYSKPNDGFGLFGRLAEYVGADQTNLPNLMLVVPS